MPYTIRPYQPEDLPALVDLMNRSYEGFGIEARTTSEEVSARLSDPAYEIYLMHDNSGQLIGGASYTFEVERGGGWGELIIEPEYRRDDTIHALMGYLEQRTATLGEQKSTPETPIHLTIYVNMTAADVINVFDERGYHHIRSVYRMRIALNSPIEAVPPPDGIEIRPFDPKNVHAVHEAYEESFSEEWGHIQRDFDTWTRFLLNRPGNDPSLWVIAWDGDQIAGFSFNRTVADKPDMAWVMGLGVRKPYRKRGLGYSLLKQSFKLFQERGYTRAGLGVDASNPTGAVALYERVGMSVYIQFVNYRKVLRGDEARIKD